MTTTFGSGLNEEFEVEAKDYEPPAPPEAQVITATTTDSETVVEQEDGVPLADSSLQDFCEAGDANAIRITSYEAPDSSRNQDATAFEEYQRDLQRLRFPESEDLHQLVAPNDVTENNTPPPAEEMIPASKVREVIEIQGIVREHQQRWAQAMSDPAFAELATQVLPAPAVEWDPAIGTTVAGQANCPALVLFLSARPEVAQQIAQMPVARAQAEVARLSARLMSEGSKQSPRRRLRDLTERTLAQRHPAASQHIAENSKRQLPSNPFVGGIVCPLTRSTGSTAVRKRKPRTRYCPTSPAV
jgi:hypothetical protein